MRVVTQHYENALVHEEHEGMSVDRFRYAWPARFECIGTTSGVIDDLRRSWLPKLLLPIFLLSFAWRVFRNSKGCGVLHVQWVPTMIVSLPAKYLRGIPIIVNVRTNPDTSFWKFVFKVLIPRAAYVVYNSENTRRLCEVVVPHPRSSVIESGIDIAQFLRPVDFVEERKDPKSVRLIVVARLVEFKGVEYLLHALTSARGAIDVRLDVYGDGPMRPVLEQLARQLDLDDILEFKGETPHGDIPKHLWESDIFVLPSIIDQYGRTEGFGAVIVEAMAAGLPIIASRVGGITDIVNDANGLLVEPKDVSGLADAIIELGRDRERRRSLATAGKDWVVSRFSEESICRRYKSIYESVLAANDRTSRGNS